MEDINKKSVCASLTNQIINNLLEMGYSWKEITKTSGVYPEEITQPSTRIPATKHYHLLKMLDEGGGEGWFLKRKNFREEFFFNRQNISYLFSDHAPHFALLCLNSSSLKNALDNYIQYRSIIGNVDTIEIKYAGNKVEIEYFYEFSELDYQFVSMINFIFISFLVSHYLGEKITFKVQSKSQSNNIFLNIFNYWDCDVEWESSRNIISFSTDNLNTYYAKFNDAIFFILKKIVDSEYSDLINVDNAKKLVETSIREMINSCDFDFKSSKALNEICLRLNISKTTLSRRLKSLDTSYKIIEKQVKLEEAIKMLNNSELSIGDISYKLGFASQSAFNKFFSDATKSTPLKFRRTN
ncbi:AraC family transcriptional regulator [Vibrio tritonius]|uniref:AraC family transcriptional regulator n=1 Tax=Vibrio tritonius TaxID=1435069 RepID=A0ABS7YJ83_9VIBR|nr:AraC family transcriptional regulator [Vibrio tritonius]MCA2015037.1 AraC family transcriptional regulator [Vibrio tritonius]